MYLVFQRFFRRLHHFILKVALGLLAAFFAACMLVLALGLLVISLLRSLLTWRKPALVEAFGQFRRFRAEARWPQGPPGHGTRERAAGDVVDVEVREITPPKTRE